jgi:AraC-like DNA-binding protein
MQSHATRMDFRTSVGRVSRVGTVLELAGLPRLLRLPLALRSLGHIPSDRRQLRQPVHRTVCDVIVLLAGGAREATYAIDGVTYSAALPAVTYTRPGWTTCNRTPGRLEVFYLSYTADAAPALAPYLAAFPAPVAHLARSAGAVRLIGEILGLGRDLLHNGNLDRIDRLAELLLTELAIACRDGHDDAGDAPVVAAASFLELHFREPVNLAQLIHDSGMPRSSFLRRWNRLFPTPPGRRLIELRLTEARRLLEEGDAQVKDIAREVGIGDPYYFSRLFRRQVGMFPTVYRDALQRPADSADRTRSGTRS